jgi:hypothetical protein
MHLMVRYGGADIARGEISCGAIQGGEDQRARNARRSAGPVVKRRTNTDPIRDALAECTQDAEDKTEFTPVQVRCSDAEANDR